MYFQTEKFGVVVLVSLVNVFITVSGFILWKTMPAVKLDNTAHVIPLISGIISTQFVITI